MTERPARFLPVCLACLVGLAGCGGSSTLAPVGNTAKTSRSSQPVVSSRSTTHVVRKGETLYSIAFQLGKDYRQLARLNGIRAPYTIYVGQRLLVQGTAKKRTKPVTTAKKRVTTTKKHVTSSKKPVSGSKSTKTGANTKMTRPKPPVVASKQLRWDWPTRGKVIETYSSKDDTRKGIDISGRLGQPVVASADGRVVYSGSGLRGYGKLIIVKHNERFLSAYAHNRKLLVKEGQHVRQGQKIAEMGRSGVDRVKLHFQIRRDGKPIDPLRYLPGHG